MRRFPLWALLWALLAGCDGGFPVSIPQTSTTGSPAMSPTTSPSADGQAGPIRVYFTNPEGSPSDPSNPARVLAGHIGQARQTIDICAFELDNQVITDALLAVSRKGVRLRLVTETNYLEERGVQALSAAGVPVVDDQRDGALMHNKFMVFDGRSVWTGSMNFTENCAYKNNNHGVFIEDARIAANYTTKFQWMFEQRRFGGAPRSSRIPNPLVTLSDGTVVENYFSTHDGVADRLTAKIDQARRSIHFLAFSFTHDGMGQAMLARASAGVEVQGVFEKSQASGGYTEFHRFRAAGGPVQVFLDANSRNLHHKVIILDGETTVAGSFNFSDGADRQNDENVIIIKNHGVAGRFEAEFQRLFAAARKAELGGRPVAVGR